MISIVVVFPAPLGPQQAEALTRFYIQIQPTDRFDGHLTLVTLDKILTANGDRHDLTII
jgi:hypothetical protein